MKNIILLVTSIMVYGTSSGQIIPTAGGQGTNSIEYWSRSGNNQGGSNNNIFGTKWNSPIYTVTGGISPTHLRTKLNGVFDAFSQYSINTYGWNQVNTTGYLLIGISNNSMADGLNIYERKGAFSMLHLNGEGSVYQEFGYRPWMKTGVTFTGNKDLSYMGLRKLSTSALEEDISETVFLWSDNSATDDGPDKLVFRFSGFGGGDGASVSSNRLSSTDLDALHVAQFTGTGLMGLGNTFGTNATGMSAANYIDPQSLLHMSYDWRSGSIYQPYGFSQITYRRDGINTPGTGETANDGLRWGIDNTLLNVDGISHLNAYLRWQENTPFIVQTDWDNTSGGINGGERLRISSVSAPGVPNPGSVFTPNTTRVAISHLGNIPITQPRSLLHLGYNTGLGLVPAGQANGWRNWMDIGTFTSNGTDHMYVGLKNEGTDRADAVINWGDNQEAGGPDKLRFIFSSSVGEGDPVSQSQDGLETMRIVPIRDTLGTYGRVGIGDFTAQGVNQEPTHKIDVVGNGRFRYLPDSIYMADSTVNKYVMVDSAGVLRWTDGAPSGSGSGVGNYCADTPSPLTDDFEIPLNGNNYYFEGQGVGINNIAMGMPCSTPLLFSKLSVLQSVGNPIVNPGIGIAGHFINNMSSGVLSVSVFGQNTSTAPGQNYAGYFQTTGVNSSAINTGIYAEASGGDINYAGYFEGDVYVNGGANSGTGYLVASDQQFKTDVFDISNAMDLVNELSPKSYYLDTTNSYNIKFSDAKQYGFIAQEVETILPEIVGETTKPAQYDSLGNVIVSEITYKNLNYNAFFAILTKGIQEQQTMIDSLQSENQELAQQVSDLNDRLTHLENCLGNLLPILCQINNSAISENDEETQQRLVQTLNVELSDGEHIVLNQNVPNPFAESTVITYSIPESVQKAQLHFYNMSGQLIKTVEITSRGSGRINVFGSDLSTGTYTYTLVADGKIVDTKRMVKSN